MASLANQPSKKALRNPGGPHGNRNPGGQTVKFARRTPSGRYVSLSREDLELSGEISGDYMDYTVHLPPTPDNQPMTDEEQYVSKGSHPGANGVKGSLCSMPACDGKLMKDERGNEVIPCECRYVPNPIALTSKFFSHVL